MWGFIYVGTFIATFAISAILKMKVDPFGGNYTAPWDSSVGTSYLGLSYGDGKANQFELYVLADMAKRAMVW